MGIKLVVLDFDGTLTEVNQESGPAVDGWRKDIGDELGISNSDISRKWSEAQASIETDPANYGWLMGIGLLRQLMLTPL